MAAGWFHDPFGGFDLRYHDGKGWTEHVSRGGRQLTDAAPLQAPGPANRLPVPGPPMVSPTPVFVVGNGLATAALVIGILAVLFGVIPLLFFITFPLAGLALIFGLVARPRSERLPGRV